MAQKDARSIQAELAKPFAAEDLEWRLQKTFESQGRMTGIAVPYVTNRAIQNRLDSVVGPENWYNQYQPWHAAGKKEARSAVSRSTSRTGASSPNGTARRIRTSSPSRAASATA